MQAGDGSWACWSHGGGDFGLVHGVDGPHATGNGRIWIGGRRIASLVFLQDMYEGTDRLNRQGVQKKKTKKKKSAHIRRGGRSGCSVAKGKPNGNKTLLQGGG
jgi:hypothetical protein